MVLNECYEDWEKDLRVWRKHLRHLRWLADYRVNIINSSYYKLQGKTVIDMGSGPQFTADLLKRVGANVTTLDKYAPCDISFDMNEDFTQIIDKKFDAVMMGAVFRYIDDKVLFWKRLENILKEDAFIFLDEYVHNPINNTFLGAFNLFEKMYEFPWDQTCSLESVKNSIGIANSLEIEQIYSCWPNYFLVGEYPFSLWYSVIVKKKALNDDDKKK